MRLLILQILYGFEMYYILYSYLITFIEYSQVMTMLDNCAVHKSKSTKFVFKKMQYSIMCLPAYSHNFAPVELCFGIIKRNLSEICKRETTKLILSQNYSKIYDAKASVKRDTVKKICRVP